MRKGFTLPEVLLTLTIIGVITSLTIPTLITSIQDEHLRQSWKKAYADISAATQMLAIERGYIDFTNHTTMRDDYEKVMKFIKEDTTGNILPSSYYWYKGSEKRDFSGFSGYAAAILSSGISAMFWIKDSDCSFESDQLKNICAEIDIDVNGKKTPNMYGKDFFAIWIVRNNGVYETYPVGIDGDGHGCAANSSEWQTSEGCAAVALTNDPMP